MLKTLREWPNKAWALVKPGGAQLAQTPLWKGSLLGSEPKPSRPITLHYLAGSCLRTSTLEDLDGKDTAPRAINLR